MSRPSGGWSVHQPAQRVEVIETMELFFRLGSAALRIVEHNGALFIYYTVIEPTKNEDGRMLCSFMYSFLTALLRDELRHCEMKNPRNCVDFMGFCDLHEIQ
ncbi:MULTISPECIES: hypothetical protein [Citrobacter freundii complex]|uniref:hypothetical protein n=1 Tax=Citrobacter freundii complex TaxID=1344959 RepID=UPI001BCF941B|nr:MULTISPECIES: hypothetical protein [Citrobacter freundii complex]ELN2652274.1 hypothetical protein [Citrobacter braakii]MDT7467501.1 hypothetical protein [Citrobacter portucalensis]